MIRILLADDHPIVCDGLRAVLSTQPDFTVVGEADRGVQVLAQVAALQPDILLLDLEMPDGDGVTTLQRLAEIGATARVIIFTAFDTDDQIVEAVPFMTHLPAILPYSMPWLVGMPFRIATGWLSNMAIAGMNLG